MQIVIGPVLTREEGYAFDAGRSLKAGFPAWVRLSSHRRGLKRRHKGRLNKVVARGP
jgi:hypothetical protein